MRFSVLALAYDGTIAHAGVLDPEVRQAIYEARALGVTVIIVTGRILDDLRQVMGDLPQVDAVVAENGAVITFPASGRSMVLARAASEPLLQALRQRSVEAGAGACVIETTAAHIMVAPRRPEGHEGRGSQRLNIVMLLLANSG